MAKADCCSEGAQPAVLTLWQVATALNAVRRKACCDANPQSVGVRTKYPRLFTTCCVHQDSLWMQGHEPSSSQDSNTTSAMCVSIRMLKQWSRHKLSTHRLIHLGKMWCWGRDSMLRRRASGNDCSRTS